MKQDQHYCHPAWLMVTAANQQVLTPNNILLLAPLVIYKALSKRLLVLGGLDAETGDKIHQCLSSTAERGWGREEIFLHHGHVKGKFHMGFHADS